MNLKNVVIVLSRPEEARNVGAACRAMANSGLSTLRIVGTREDIDSGKVFTLALHAREIFERAGFFPSISEACADCACICATTRRRGKRRKGKLLFPEEVAALADRITGAGAEGGKLAIVFGCERTGLSDSEIGECNLAATIPASAEFGSLNLSHAVQIMGYALFRFGSRARAGYIPVDSERLARTVSIISGDLRKIGFFSVAGQSAMEAFWRDILSRAALSESEASYIEKTFDKAAGLAGRNKKTAQQDRLPLDAGTEEPFADE